MNILWWTRDKITGAMLLEVDAHPKPIKIWGASFTGPEDPKLIRLIEDVVAEFKGRRTLPENRHDHGWPKE